MLKMTESGNVGKFYRNLDISGSVMPGDMRRGGRDVTYCIVLYCIVLYCGRIPAANAPGCTAVEGLLYKH